jgi:DNA-directed RNA polymerase III subunit RPC4
LPVQDAEDSVVDRLCLDDLAAAEEQLFLLQLPSSLPVAAPAVKQEHRTQQAGRRKGAAAAAGGGGEGLEEVKLSRLGALEGTSISQVPQGKLGKLLVFESGKVKLQIGDVVLDVGSGMPCLARQEVAAVNHEAGHLVLLGEVSQRVVVSPNVWQLMGKEEVGRWQRAEGCMTTESWVEQLQEQEEHGGEDGRLEGGGMGHGQKEAAAAGKGGRGGGGRSAAANVVAEDVVRPKTQQGMEVNGGVENGRDDVEPMDMDGEQDRNRDGGLSNGVGSTGLKGEVEQIATGQQQQQQQQQQQGQRQQQQQQQQGMLDGRGIGSRPAQVDLLGLPLPAAGGAARTKSKFKPKAAVKKES